MDKIKLSDVRKIHKVFCARFHEKMPNAMPMDGEAFTHESVKRAQDRGMKTVLLETRLGFSARRNVPEVQKSDKFKNELDHLASILDMCGLLEEPE